MKKCDAMIKNQLFELKIMSSIFFITIVSSHIAFIQERRKMIFFVNVIWQNNCIMDEKLHDKWKIEKQSYTMDEDYGIKVVKWMKTKEKVLKWTFIAKKVAHNWQKITQWL